MSLGSALPDGSMGEVREFYETIGWRRAADGAFQNARYEDLRPVSRRYVLRSHRRVAEHLPRSGRFLLDAGSGPIQYPAYLEYSAGFEHRVCVDLSMRALREAHGRIGGHGLFVQADVSVLPFRNGSFDAAVSLHVLHHLPVDSQARSVHELVRTLVPGASAVVVNGWRTSLLMILVHPLILLSDLLRRLRRDRQPPELKPAAIARGDATGTRIERVGWAWWSARAKEGVQIRIFSWRSLSVQCMRAMIHPRIGGERILRVAETLEDRFPRMLGRVGQYPLVVLRAG